MVTLLSTLGRSVLVSTYQAGKLVMLRVKDGVLNTHYRNFSRPMGLDATLKDVAIGTRQDVVFFENVPAVIPRIEPAGAYDACFVPRRTHTTGYIDIHEMAFDANGQLWIVATGFGCLATLDPAYSFVPRWRPPFLSALAPEDRCHLNGLARGAGGGGASRKKSRYARRPSPVNRRSTLARAAAPTRWRKAASPRRRVTISLAWALV